MMAQASAETPGSERAIGGGAVAVSGTALAACAACCALPMMFPALLLGGGGAGVAWIGGARMGLVLLALLAVAAGWGWMILQSRRSRRRPRGASIRLMSIATLLAALAVAWGALERVLLGALQ